MAHARWWPIACLAIAVTGCGERSELEPSALTPTSIPSVQLAAFVYEGDARFPERGEAGIKAFEDLVGKRLASVMWYVTWDDPFPSRDVAVVHRHGATPHVTWELFWPSQDPNNARTLPQSETGLDDVLAGKHDEYIDRFATAGAAAEGPVFIRFLHEFNGNWYTWSGNKNGRENGGPAKVREVWRYVVDRCRDRGANNFVWLWCPHGPSIDVVDEPWNRLAEYWPGEDYVDWHAIDGYNWYPKDPWGGTRPYRDPTEVFDPTYDECLKLAQLPVMIAETGTGEFELDEKNKSTWIKALFAEVTRRPMIRMVVWFHIKKERDWRVNSSPESLAAFRRAVQMPGVSSTPEPFPDLPRVP